MPKSTSQYILDLARELLDDIELSRLQSEQLLAKASRLVRLAGSDEARAFILYELHGYNSVDPVAVKYMSLTGRWTNKSKEEGYFGPLSVQESLLRAKEAKLKALSMPSISGEWVNLAITNIIQQINSATSEISVFSQIRSRVTAQIHRIVYDIYYEREFADVAQTTFERYKTEVDIKIASKAGEVISKIPAITSRLAEGDTEAVSQALVTIRRIIDSFADNIFPANDETFNIDGNELKLDASKHKNRINAYVALRCLSQSRRQKIKQNLNNLYDRVSTGVHSEISTEEAFSLFLNTYLLLGEILHLPEPKAADSN